MSLLTAEQRHMIRNQECSAREADLLDTCDALDAEIAHLRDLLYEIGLAAANNSPEEEVERIDELVDQRLPPHA